MSSVLGVFQHDRNMAFLYVLSELEGNQGLLLSLQLGIIHSNDVKLGNSTGETKIFINTNISDMVIILAFSVLIPCLLKTVVLMNYFKH